VDEELVISSIRREIMTDEQMEWLANHLSGLGTGLMILISVSVVNSFLIVGILVFK
jgi:hypothetical protein